MTLISNIITSFINASERSERALGEIDLSHFKLEARLMMRGKGDTDREGLRQIKTIIRKEKEHVSKYKE